MDYPDFVTKIVFHGGAGSDNTSELGGVQFQLDSLLIDIGMPPDRSNALFDFPQDVRWYNAIDSLDALGLLPANLGINRRDIPVRFANTESDEPRVSGILETHWHLDHIGYVSYVDPRIKIFMHYLAKTGLYAWQYTSMPNKNQFVDFYAKNMILPSKQGTKIASGEASRILRREYVFDDYETFEHEGLRITAYPVDHSLPGSCGFIIETSGGLRVAVSGDFRFRGRRPHDTERFLDAVNDCDIFFSEFSLLHFNHYGTEFDVENILGEIFVKCL